MNRIKKSLPNIAVYLLATVLIIVIAIIKQPTLRSYFAIGNTEMWQKLITKVNESSPTIAQELWQFRDFYSRGTLHLAKNETIVVPRKILNTVALPDTFAPYLLFNSPRTLSVEGSIIEDTEITSLTKKISQDSSWNSIAQSNSVQIFESIDQKNALIIAVFDPQTASTANGYLYFDLRDEQFQKELSGKKWLSISLITLK